MIPTPFWKGHKAPPTIVESQIFSATTVFGSISFTFGAAAAGDFLCVPLVNVTHSNINLTAGWTSSAIQPSDGGIDATYWLCWKFATGGETTFTASLFSGSGMKAAVFFNARGSDGTLYNSTFLKDHVAGTVVTAPVLTVPVGCLSISTLAGGDDFPSSHTSFTCTVSGAGWSLLQDACSNISGADQADVTVATSTGVGTLAAAVGTFSRSVAGHIGGSFYLKSP